MIGMTLRCPVTGERGTVDAQTVQPAVINAHQRLSVWL